MILGKVNVHIAKYPLANWQCHTKNQVNGD